MKFGVIVVRQIIDLLPQFPTFFEGIYEMRTNIQSQDAALVEKIEDLYYSTNAKSNKGKVSQPPSGANEDKNEEEHFESQPSSVVKEDAKHQGPSARGGRAEQTVPKVIDSEFYPNMYQNP